eukprot:GFYU01006035.1.p1 GENE.GFYU01006035.1~~GFYU01006035.1.p1  ORF type:complete len:696 (-),score=185.54 GFYU01006035.1:78-1871(-)
MLRTKTRGSRQPFWQRQQKYIPPPSSAGSRGSRSSGEHSRSSRNSGRSSRTSRTSRTSGNTRTSRSRRSGRSGRSVNPTTRSSRTFSLAGSRTSKTKSSNTKSRKTASETGTILSDSLIFGTDDYEKIRNAHRQARVAPSIRSLTAKTLSDDGEGYLRQRTRRTRPKKPESVSSATLSIDGNDKGSATTGETGASVKSGSSGEASVLIPWAEVLEQQNMTSAFIDQLEIDGRVMRQQQPVRQDNSYFTSGRWDDDAQDIDQTMSTFTGMPSERQTRSDRLTGKWDHPGFRKQANVYDPDATENDITYASQVSATLSYHPTAGYRTAEVTDGQATMTFKTGHSRGGQTTSGRVIIDRMGGDMDSDDTFYDISDDEVTEHEVVYQPKQDPNGELNVAHWQLSWGIMLFYNLFYRHMLTTITDLGFVFGMLFLNSAHNFILYAYRQRRSHFRHQLQSQREDDDDSPIIIKDSMILPYRERLCRQYFFMSVAQRLSLFIYVAVLFILKYSWNEGTYGNTLDLTSSQINDKLILCLCAAVVEFLETWIMWSIIRTFFKRDFIYDGSEIFNKPKYLIQCFMWGVFATVSIYWVLHPKHLQPLI